MNFRNVKQNLIQYESGVNYIQFNNKNPTRHNLINNTNKHYLNNKNKII